MTHTERRERRKEIAEAIEAGESVATVCQRFGLHPATVAEACRENGVKIPAQPTQHRTISIPTLSIIAARQNTDATLEEIAAAHGVTRTWVSETLRRAKAAGIRFPGR